MGFFFQLETYNLVEKEIDHFFSYFQPFLNNKKGLFNIDW